MRPYYKLSLRDIPMSSVPPNGAHNPVIRVGEAYDEEDDDEVIVDSIFNIATASTTV